ncbi:hypothetical protein ACFX1T_043165 [Malus domestica]
MDSCCSSSSSCYLHPSRSLDGWFAQPDYDNIKFAEYLNGFMREYQSTLLQPKLRYTVLKEADNANYNWFEEEDDVRNKLGLFRKVPLVDRSVGSFTCEICLETRDANGDHSISSDFCGHFYCIACWAAYVSESIWCWMFVSKMSSSGL